MKAAQSSRRLSRSVPGSSRARTCMVRSPGTAGGSSASTVSTATTPAGVAMETAAAALSPGGGPLGPAPPGAARGRRQGRCRSWPWRGGVSPVGRRHIVLFKIKESPTFLSCLLTNTQKTNTY
uniref:Uncharacterized protein n=1 Tax=Strix occidentalis caurina TaxID=311401 RepID=A0A8D0EHG3_STROC